MSHFAHSKLTSRVLRRTPLGPKPRSCDTGRFEAIRRAPLAARRHQWTDLRSLSLYSGPARPAASTSILHQHRFQPQSAASRNRLSSTMSSATNFFDFTVLDAADTEVPLANYKGKVVLVVNTASKCGFTYQYKNLESVYQALKKEYPDDFTVIGFPCNQFGGQEPGSNEEIQNFCSLEQKTTFPVMAKINVNGNDAHPLYQWLKKEKPGLLGLERIKWNFEKFLIGRDGKVIDRWASTTEPEKIQNKIIEAIKAPAPQ
ncbi:hypothetical protein TsFJ059_001697 [Trichoderma semiorbis]|uniref:Glutathione peroxidase n=1 Tax=Trichoderma semiorbis TaxID=1491008 RepID=A0A9P8HXF5_9HYPO|nr:hypothetical protein TsFJ059_001697 [Trichoderma semiorbis]